MNISLRQFFFLFLTCFSFVSEKVWACYYCAEASQYCVRYEEKCQSYSQRCDAYETVCDGYALQCDSYSVVCNDYDENGNCISTSQVCNSYSNYCTSYSQRCLSYSTVCDYYGLSCAEYQTFCDRYAYGQTITFAGNASSTFAGKLNRITVRDQNSSNYESKETSTNGTYRISILASDDSAGNNSVNICESMGLMYPEVCQNYSIADSCTNPTVTIDFAPQPATAVNKLYQAYHGRDATSKELAYMQNYISLYGYTNGGRSLMQGSVPLTRFLSTYWPTSKAGVKAGYDCSLSAPKGSVAYNCYFAWHAAMDQVLSAGKLSVDGLPIGTCSSYSNVRTLFERGCQYPGQNLRDARLNCKCF